jgi:hypothetical protein
VSTFIHVPSEKARTCFDALDGDGALRGGDGGRHSRCRFVFFRNRFWERLVVNIGVVLMFAGSYSGFLRRR